MASGPERFDVNLKQKIFERDEWKCVKCLGAANDVHHRKLRGMGGSKLLNGPGNLISLCRYCHSWIHAHPADSYKLGFLVHSWDNPEDTGIVTQYGVIEVREDGTRSVKGSCGPLF